MADKKYVSNINVTDRYREVVFAGTPFFKERLVEHTFNKLVRQRHITVYIASSPIQAVGNPKGKLLASIPATTPAAAIHPPTLSKAEKAENAKQAAIASKRARVIVAEKGAAKKVEKVDVAQANLEDEIAATAALETAEAAEVVEKAETAEEAEKVSTVEKIWNCDPEVIGELDMTFLLSSYRTQCEDYNITPEEFTDKALLVAQLSSQFVPK